MITLNLSKSLFVQKFYPHLYDYTHRWECYMGSAGSAKSYFITQKLIVRACSQKIRILVCRRYGTTIRQTTFSLFKNILSKWEIIQFVKVNESDYRITFPNGSEIIFIGLDEETKLLSLDNIGCIFVEEAYEVPSDIIEQLNLRMRGNVDNQQIILAFNPISSNSWLYNFCEVNPPESFEYIHSTYKDNPFLPDEYIKALEELRTKNPQKARIYCDGEWGVDTDGLVFKNWTEKEFDIDELSHLEHRVGSDLGYIDPSTIVCSLYDKQLSLIYVYDEFYQSGCQLDDIYGAMIKMQLQKSKIWMDSAEPRVIDYFRQKGLYTVPCIKGQGSVEARITFLQNNKIIVKPSCTHILNELKNFSYEKDRNGKFTDKTTHEFSHAIDGLGYAYSDIYTKKSLRTLPKSILGI